MASPKYKYLSPEWAEEVKRRANEMLTPERMKHITSSMLTVNRNCPDGVDRAVYYEIVDGVVTDYLVDEVLAQQPKHVVDFLLQTSVLERMIGSLCDAVTGQQNGPDPHLL